MAQIFKDFFSNQASEYAKYRPSYPPELYHYLASLVSHHRSAWDCATGNGQAALGLIKYFDHVIATDASARQLERATPCKGVDYRVATAETCGIPSRSVDLVTVAQAAHWFRLDEFYNEVRRVLKPGGIIALWTYKKSMIEPEIDAMVNHYAEVTVKDYWDPTVALADEGYRTINFPFEEIIPPDFFIRVEWTLDDLIGYLRSWSSTQKFIVVKSHDPVDYIRKELLPLWGDPSERKTTSWKINFRIGRMQLEL